MRGTGVFILIVLCVLALPYSAGAQGAFRDRPQMRGTRTANTTSTPVAIPLPKARPFEAGPRTSSPAQAQTQPAEEPSGPSDCFIALSADGAEVQQLPPIVEANGCEAPDVVQLDAIRTADRRRIPLSPPAVLRCSMATAVVRWVRDDLQALVASQGAALSSLDNFNSFECRGRNRVVGAKTSEHGRANALDIRGFIVNGGRKLELTNPEISREFRDAVRISACRRFTTVLGPGSDGYHEDHVHVDLAERRGGFRLCQWDVRDPEMPLPRERPAEAGPRETEANKSP
jgi:hypothetical protein